MNLRPWRVPPWCVDTVILLGIAAVGLCVVYGVAFMGWIVFQCLVR